MVPAAAIISFPAKIVPPGGIGSPTGAPVGPKRCATDRDPLVISHSTDVEWVRKYGSVLRATAEKYPQPPLSNCRAGPRPRLDLIHA